MSLLSHRFRLIGLWVITVLGLAATHGGEFPAFEQLPLRPEPPDPLVMFDGTPVRSRDDWFNKRRPELKALFEYYMYGKAPPPPDNLSAMVVRTDEKCLDGKATLREITIKFGPRSAPPINLLLIVPNNRKGPAPVFVGLNFCGNHAVLSDSGIALPAQWIYKSCAGVENERATDKGRGAQFNVWCPDLLVERGYALATFYNGDIDPDTPELTDGIHPHYLPTGQDKLGEHDWGTIRAWAWGMSRVVDYLVTRPDIDQSRICAIGHSRLGKTALLAAAFDERIALVVPHQSGTGGMALNRGNDQETVARINKSFPHWFSDSFVPFGDHETKLPIDQHLLVALVAPRPLFDGEGDQDKWANFDNALRTLQGADKVYKFLGGRGLVGSGVVREDEPFTDSNCGDLVQYKRDEKHVLNRAYWQRILDFADRKLPSSH
jgi:hypothetical protein